MIEVAQNLPTRPPASTLPSTDFSQPLITPEASVEPEKYKDDPERLRAEEIATVFALNYQKDPTKTNAGADRLAMQAYDQMLLVFEGYIRAKANELSATFPDAHHVKQDLISIGRATLLDNMKRWHPSQGRRFSRGNVDRNIKSAMYKHLNHEERIVDLPSKVLKDMFRLNAAKASGNPEAITDVTRGWTKNHLEAVQQYAPHAHPHNNRNYIISESEGENGNHLTYHATFESSVALRGTTIASTAPSPNRSPKTATFGRSSRRNCATFRTTKNSQSAPNSSSAKSRKATTTGRQPSATSAADTMSPAKASDNVSPAA